MTSDYYFKKWKGTLENLTNVVKLDLEYQETKAHDKEICDVVQRLTGTLGSYIACYNETLDCLQHNLQLQKTDYIADIVKTIVARILELKHQLTKLEGTYVQFLCNGLIERKLTPYDAEFLDIPVKYERSELINSAVEEAFRKAIEMKETEMNNFQSKHDDPLDQDNLLEEVNWWEDGNVDEKEHKGINVTEVYKMEEKISEETLKRREIVALIQAHERSRQVILTKTHQKQKREMWEKELKGILNPQAPVNVRERSAKLIQRVLRYYFELKRKKIKDCKRDELLHLNYCNKVNTEQSQIDKEANTKYSELYKKYVKERKINCFKYKENYLKRKQDNIAEEFRDHIREWFEKWYKEIKFFYDIPRENQGGSSLILKEEIPSPLEWLEEYKIYLETKKANKNKTALQLKWEKQELRKEEMILKREELKKKNLEADLLKKMMKNPTLHPGYHYPISHKTENILMLKEFTVSALFSTFTAFVTTYHVSVTRLQSRFIPLSRVKLTNAIKKYNNYWSEFDDGETIEAKEKWITTIDEELLCAEAKLETCNSVDDDMREELKILKKALKEEYESKGEEIPKQIKEKTPKKKKRRKIKGEINEHIQDKLINLAMKGYLKEYPKTYFKNFIGDVNFAGADLRCGLQSVVPFGGEVRAVWWEKCREVIHGFKKVLLFGPKASGKTTLVHIMATVNDAVLYELDPCEVEVENMSTDYLQQLMNLVATCAKNTQPSIIYIKHVDRLYYTKVPPEERYRNYDLIKRFFIRKLFKKIKKQDNITVIGSVTEPWMTKSKQMLKKFTTVLLLPETNYSSVHLILRNWLINNRIVPKDLDIQSLAYLLREYSFGHIVNKLDSFLTAERIVHIAANGLNPQDIYDYFLEDKNETVIDYKRFLKWYTDKTHWGQLERKHLEERREFELLVEMWKEKMEKKNESP